MMDSVPGEGESKQKKVYPRKLTDKRREQNRQAQKVYREKQKKKIEELERKIEEVTASTSTSAPSSSRSGNSAVTPEHPPDTNDAFPIPATSTSAFAPITAVEVGGYPNDPATTLSELDLTLGDLHDFSFQNEPFETDPASIALPNFSLPYQAPTATAAWSTTDFTTTANMPPIASETSQSLFSSDEVFRPGAGETFAEVTDDAVEEIMPLGNIIVPATLNTVSPNPVRYPDTAFLLNHLTLSSEKSLSALFDIASLLGITKDAYANDHQSPFYDPNILSGTCGSPLAMARVHREGYSYLKPDLRPSTMQVTYPHFSYVDCFIWPSFRQRVLKAILEGKLDGMELFVDSISDGLVCWGNSNRKKGAGMGVPWDQRSWEARPWFLKKYAWLIGGEDEDIVRGSRWWRFMRGEKDDDE